MKKKIVYGQGAYGLYIDVVLWIYDQHSTGEKKK
jgi:hypothetical protein